MSSFLPSPATSLTKPVFNAVQLRRNPIPEALCFRYRAVICDRRPIHTGARMIYTYQCRWNIIWICSRGGFDRRDGNDQIRCGGGGVGSCCRCSCRIGRHWILRIRRGGLRGMEADWAEWKTKCAIIWLGGKSKRVTDYVIDFGVFYLQSVSISIVIV
jgi:hypothetical protein